MPWCEPCARFYNPNSVNDDGTCPECGAEVSAPDELVAENKVPWHFWAGLLAISIYLGWRVIQGVLLLF